MPHPLGDRIRAIAYVRVSSDEQASEGVSLDAQRARLISHAAAAGLHLVATIEDAGRSASTLRRPGLEAALEQLRAGGADALLCVKLDRLTRKVGDLEQLLAAHFGADAPHTLLLAAEPHDAKTATGRLTLRILVAIAEHELDQVAARTQAAVDHKRAAGEVVGAVPFGFDRDGDRLVPNAAEQETLRRARELDAGGLGLRAIARRLNDDDRPTKRGGRWDATAVKRLLTRGARGAADGDDAS
jgi:site-specific DNA recombinase